MDFKFESLMDEEGAQILSDFYSVVPEGLRGSVESLSEGEFGFPALVGEALGVFSDGTLASFFLFTLGLGSRKQISTVVLRYAYPMSAAWFDILSITSLYLL